MFKYYTLAFRESAKNKQENKGDIKKAIQPLEKSLKVYPDVKATPTLPQQTKSRLAAH